MTTLDQPREVAPDAAIEARASFWSSRRALWRSIGALLLLAFPLFFFRLGAWAFFDPDEGRYGEIPRAMLATGDYITPMLNGVGFYDKPPLLYWGIAFFYKVFGVSEGAARLVPALAALAAVFGTWALARRMFGPRAGFLSGFIISTCLVWPVMARVVLTDMLVSSLIFLAMAFWWLSRSEDNAQKRFWFNFSFWTTLALGVLAKGPIAVVLAGGSIVFYTVLTGEYDKLKRIGWLSGVLWLLLIAAPWFVAVQMHNPEFNHAFWYQQHFGRFLGLLVEKDHNYGPYYFFVMIPLIFFPWTFFAPLALAAGWKKIWPGRGQQRSENGRAALFLCCGVLFMTLFFTGSSSKLVTYILPVLPLMSVALGGYFENYLRKNGIEWSRGLKNSAHALAVTLIVVGVGALIAGPRALAKNNVPPASILVLGSAFILWGVALFLIPLKLRLRGVLATTGLGFCVIFVIATGVIGAIAYQTTTKALIEAIGPGLGKDTQIVSQSFTQSLTFYTQRRVAMLGEPDELRASLPHIDQIERERWFLSEEAEIRRFAQAKTPVYFVTRKSENRVARMRQQFNELGADVRPITANGRFVFMGNAAARKLTPPDANALEVHSLTQ